MFPEPKKAGLGLCPPPGRPWRPPAPPGIPAVTGNPKPGATDSQSPDFQAQAPSPEAGRVTGALFAGEIPAPSVVPTDQMAWF